MIPLMYLELSFLIMVLKYNLYSQHSSSYSVAGMSFFVTGSFYFIYTDLTFCSEPIVLRLCLLERADRAECE